MSLGIGTLENNRVGPYMGVKRDQVLRFPNGRSFRIITYQAYNAFGLVGYEKNGIAVMDEDNREVLADEISNATCGWEVPNKEQEDLFSEISEMDWGEFKEFVNSQNRVRRHLT